MSSIDSLPTAAAVSRHKLKRKPRRGLPGEGPTAALSVLSVAAIAALWWAATSFHWVAPLFLPSPQAVWSAFIDAWNGRIQGGLPLSEHLLWSAIRVFGAFALASVTAVPVGILMGVSRIARGLLDPPLEFYRPLPPLAYLPLVVIWFGIDETAKLIVIYLACFAPVAMAARAGARSASAEQINAASARRQFRAGRAPCGFARGVARDTDRAEDRYRLWLDHACRR
jgi:taurine transport system permease protein